MYVDGLDDTGDRHQKHTQQGQSCEAPVFDSAFARLAIYWNQARYTLTKFLISQLDVSRIHWSLENPEGHRPNNSRSLLVWARLTGISVCFLSSMRNW
jgi:hypothetical protein